MSSEIMKVSINDIADVLMGQSPSSDSCNITQDGLPFYQGVTDFGELYPSPRMYCSEPKKVAHLGDILFSVRAPIARINVANHRCSTGRGVAIIRAKKKSDQLFLRYAIESIWWYWDSLEGSGAIFSNAKKEDILNAEIPWGDENYRANIASQLSSLENLLLMQKTMNSTIKAFIQCIFRSWFIDFDPVKAKSEGKLSYDMDEETATLFPDSFEESELGLLPSGWKIGRIGDMANISSGKHQPKRLVERSNEYSTPLLGGTGIIGWTDESLFNEPIIVTGRVGTLGVVKKYIHPVYPSDNTLVFKTKKPSSFHYLYYQLKLQDFGAYNRGSTQPLISQSDMKKLKIIIPNNDVLLAFEEKIRPIVLLSLLIEEKCKSLAKTRDLLLPRLMSGELKVN